MRVTPDQGEVDIVGIYGGAGGFAANTDQVLGWGRDVVGAAVQVQEVAMATGAQAHALRFGGPVEVAAQARGVLELVSGLVPATERAADRLRGLGTDLASAGLRYAATESANTGLLARYYGVGALEVGLARRLAVWLPAEAGPAGQLLSFVRGKLGVRTPGWQEWLTADDTDRAAMISGLGTVVGEVVSPRPVGRLEAPLGLDIGDGPEAVGKLSSFVAGFYRGRGSSEVTWAALNSRVTTPDAHGSDAPEGYADLIQGVREAYAQGDDTITMRQTTYQGAFSTPHKVAYVSVPGVQSWQLPGPGFDPHVTDLSQAARLLGSGSGAEYVDAVALAIMESGIDPKTPIVLSGHSLGGMVALAVSKKLQQSGYRPAAVVTAGSPSAPIEAASGIPIVSLENTGDVVPDLDGVGPQDRADRTTISVTRNVGTVIGNHDVVGYEAAGRAVDALVRSGEAGSSLTAAGVVMAGQGLLRRPGEQATTQTSTYRLGMGEQGRPPGAVVNDNRKTPRHTVMGPQPGSGGGQGSWPSAPGPIGGAVDAAKQTWEDAKEAKELLDRVREVGHAKGPVLLP